VLKIRFTINKKIFLGHFAINMAVSCKVEGKDESISSQCKTRPKEKKWKNEK